MISLIDALTVDSGVAVVAAATHRTRVHTSLLQPQRLGCEVRCRAAAARAPCAPCSRPALSLPRLLQIVQPCEMPASCMYPMRIFVLRGQN